MYNGIINVYKEAGFTSHDVVAKLRGIFGQRKIGHTGTLDPAATGVLPVCLGNGTKLVDMITDRSKVYEARVLLGVTTDTEEPRPERESLPGSSLPETVKTLRIISKGCLKASQVGMTRYRQCTLR